MNIPKLSQKEAVILRLLENRGEMYGLEMVQTSPDLKRGTIYVTLNRMAEKGYVDSRHEKEEGAAGLPRRLFVSTPLGRRVLRAWETAAAAIELELAPAELAGVIDPKR